jgi:2-octaprenyl-6-methoxyphenol hydroxylase
MSKQKFDLVIVGGGLVGATLALAVNQSCPQLSIAIIEAVATSENNQPSFDSRSIAFAQGSKALLSDYGLWASLAQYAEPINKIQVSDCGHIGKTYLNAQQFNLSALGYVLEVRHLGAALDYRLKKQRTNVSWFCPATINDIDEQADELTITLSDGQKLKTPLLLAADGGGSVTRQLAHIENRSSDYAQTAIIANIGVEGGHQNQAFERFTQTGPIALLPIADNRYSLVWCVSPDEAVKMEAWDDETFLSELQNAFGYRAGRLIKVGKRFSYPLALTLAQDMVGHRVALVGNASHTIHPIAGQGFNLGLRDIEALRQMIVRHADDIGSYQALSEYRTLRQDDLNQVVGMTDSLVRLFSNDNKVLALGRTIGLLSMQMFDCLKQPVAYQGMGLNAKAKFKPIPIKQNEDVIKERN